MGCRAGTPWREPPAPKAEQAHPRGHSGGIQPSPLASSSLASPLASSPAAGEKLHLGLSPSLRVSLDPPCVGVLGQHFSA